MILRSLRRTPFSRHSLILAIASPRAKLPNSGQKRPSRRMTRVQKRCLTVAIFAHRSRRATFKRGDARGAESFGRNEPDEVFATLASYKYALALDVFKERALLWPVDVPEPKLSSYTPMMRPHHNQPWCKTVGLSVIDVTQLPSLFLARREVFLIAVAKSCPA